MSLVAVGAALLLVSLSPIRDTRIDKSGPERDWYMLSLLLVLFIFGYLGYLYLLLHQVVTINDVVICLILFGGGVFVVSVTRMSIASVNHIKHIAALEHHHALHDQLTNLPNRNFLYERISQTIEQAVDKRQSFAVILMDIDRFKEVNDVLGHFCGDRLLQLLSPRLKSVLRETDILARLGGDEFALVLPDTNTDAATTMVKKILAVTHTPFLIEGHELSVDMSIGISMFPEHGEDNDTLLQHADIAMYNAKRNAGDYALYNIEQEEFSLSRLTMLGRLRDALAKDELTLHYQPIMSLRSAKPWGAEALVRWQHDELGAIPPDEFIPLAEQLGMIRQVTQYVIRKVLMQIKQWQQQGIELCVSVNLSVCDIQDIRFPETVMTLLNEFGIKPAALNFEITESSVMTDSEQARKVLKELTDLGFALSIDDFGTGYSSLSYLKQLPANKLKIDKSFVQNVIDDDNDAVIVRSTIDLAHNMGRAVIAEGVEDKDVYQLLEILGCDMAQGFYICKPLSPLELEKWLTNSPWKAARPFSPYTLPASS